MISVRDRRRFTMTDVWMENATGTPVGAEAMLAATRRALDELNAD